MRPAGVAALRGGRGRRPAGSRARAAGPAAEPAVKRRCQRAVVVCLAEPSLSGCAPEAGAAREPHGLAVVVNPQRQWCEGTQWVTPPRRGRGSQVTVSRIGQLLQGCCDSGPAPRQVLGMHRKDGLQVQASRPATHTMGYFYSRNVLRWLSSSRSKPCLSEYRKTFIHEANLTNEVRNTGHFYPK